MTIADIQRFESFIDKDFGPKHCWQWLSAKSRKGYGSFWLEGKPEKATWIAFKLFKHQDPSGNMVLHTCDNPSCVNPDHLYLGDNRQNMLDMWQRGRRVGKRPKCHPDRKYAGLDMCVACYKRSRKPIKYCLECGIQLSFRKFAVCSESCRHVRAMKLQRERRNNGKTN